MDHDSAGLVTLHSVLIRHTSSPELATHTTPSATARPTGCGATSKGFGHFVRGGMLRVQNDRDVPP
jgi:hypothetical protein